jgi:hypothetical protein
MLTNFLKRHTPPHSSFKVVLGEILFFKEMYRYLMGFEHLIFVNLFIIVVFQAENGKDFIVLANIMESCLPICDCPFSCCDIMWLQNWCAVNLNIDIIVANLRIVNTDKGFQDYNRLFQADLVAFWGSFLLIYQPLYCCFNVIVIKRQCSGTFRSRKKPRKRLMHFKAKRVLQKFILSLGLDFRLYWGLLCG